MGLESSLTSPSKQVQVAISSSPCGSYARLRRDSNIANGHGTFVLLPADAAGAGRHTIC